MPIMKRVSRSDMEGRKIIRVTCRLKNGGSSANIFAGKAAYIKANNFIDRVEKNGCRLLHIDVE